MYLFIIGPVNINTVYMALSSKQAIQETIALNLLTVLCFESPNMIRLKEFSQLGKVLVQLLEESLLQQLNVVS